MNLIHPAQHLTPCLKVRPRNSIINRNVLKDAGVDKTKKDGQLVEMKLNLRCTHFEEDQMKCRVQLGIRGVNQMTRSLELNSSTHPIH